MAGPQLLAHVASRDRKAEGPAVPFQPVQGEVIGNEAVVHPIGLTAVQKRDGRQETFAKDLPS